MTVVYLFTVFFSMAFLILGAILAILSPEAFETIRRGVRFILAKRGRQLSPTDVSTDVSPAIESVHHFEE